MPSENLSPDRCFKTPCQCHHGCVFREGKISFSTKHLVCHGNNFTSYFALPCLRSKPSTFQGKYQIVAIPLLWTAESLPDRTVKLMTCTSLSPATNTLQRPVHNILSALSAVIERALQSPCFTLSFFALTRVTGIAFWFLKVWRFAQIAWHVKKARVLWAPYTNLAFCAS